MFELLLSLTALVLVIGTAVAYWRTRDILHPMLFLGPLFLYSAVMEPLLVRHALDQFFRYPETLNPVLLLNLLGVTVLVLGALHEPGGRAQPRRALQDGERAKLRRIACVLSVAGLAAYAYGIANAGGLVAAFSQVKGGGDTSSGYVGEAMNLGLVAAAMIAISQYRRSWTMNTLLLLVLGLLPNLIQGTLGGRRGPLFLVLASATFAWVMARRRTPRLWMVGGALATILLAVSFVGSQRQHLYLGSTQAEVRWSDFLNVLTPGEVDAGNNFVYGAGFVLATQTSGHYTWGRELAVNLFVRPIPRQLWPRKYEDVGATWITSDRPGLGVLTPDEWQAAVGWVPLQGSSAMCISDLFGEFGWGAILVMYLIGRAFAELRFRRQTRQRVWDLLYLEALILSIYLATQSFSAFYHRYLILAVPTMLAWQLFMNRTSLPESASLNKRYQRALAPRVVARAHVRPLA